MSRAARRRRRDEDEIASSGVRVRAQEQLLIDAVDEFPIGRMLCNTGRGQLPRSYAAAHPGSHATCWFLDVYQRDRAEQEGRDKPSAAESDLLEASDPLTLSPIGIGERGPETRQPSAISYACTADPPGDNYDVVAWSCSARGDGELTRDMLQAGHERLKMGGRMVASIDNPSDEWLHDELRKLFPKVTRRPLEAGTLYLATKTARLPKVKSFDAEFAFRDQRRLIFACSRPGVFSHRHIDPGARALINSMHIERRNKVLDLGCGAGVVGLAALYRADDVRVLAVDSNPRALQCAERGAKRNDLSGLETLLDATGDRIPPNSFDVVCANPPYFSHYRIAELFLQMAHRALKLRGTVHVVTKAPDWFVEHMPAYFGRVEPQPVKSYWVLTGRKKDV
jgi:16S rRNA G1207 methylase RsmC